MPFCRESTVSTLDLDTFEDQRAYTRGIAHIVSTWDLDTFVDHF